MRNEKSTWCGYANEQHAYYIRLIENDAVKATDYSVKIQIAKQPKDDTIFKKIFLVKRFWIHWKGLQLLPQ